jgi:lysylphosphatidylglycerol synthetase-like protein (DUF2156 family)
MIYLLLAALLLFITSTIYISYQKSTDTKKFILSLGILLLLIIFTYSSKVLLIYKPLLILHIALLIMAWRAYYFYLFKDKWQPYWIASPLISILIFVNIALFFRENG